MVGAPVTMSHIGVAIPPAALIVSIFRAVAARVGIAGAEIFAIGIWIILGTPAGVGNYFLRLHGREQRGGGESRCA